MPKVRANHLIAITRSTIASFPELDLRPILVEKLGGLTGSEEFIDCALLGEVARLPEKVSGDPTINTRAFSGSDLLDFGLLGEIYLRAPSLLDALMMCERYQFNRGDFARFRVLSEGDYVTVRFEALSPLLGFGMHLALYMSIYRFMEISVDSEVKLKSLSFNDPDAVQYFPKLRKRLGHSLELSIGESEMVFDRESLNQRSRYYDRFIWKNLARALSSSKYAYDIDNIVQSVSRAIDFHLNRGVRPSIELIAKEMYTSKRNLQRALKEKGCNFATELKMAMLERAKHLLCDTDETLLNISDALGFSSQDSFSRFFKSNTGLAPVLYRKNCYDSIAA